MLNYVTNKCIYVQVQFMKMVIHRNCFKNKLPKRREIDCEGQNIETSVRKMSLVCLLLRFWCTCNFSGVFSPLNFWIKLLQHKNKRYAFTVFYSNQITMTCFCMTGQSQHIDGGKTALTVQFNYSHIGSGCRGGLLDPPTLPFDWRFFCHVGSSSRKDTRKKIFSNICIGSGIICTTEHLLELSFVW